MPTKPKTATPIVRRCETHLLHETPLSPPELASHVAHGHEECGFERLEFLDEQRFVAETYDTGVCPFRFFIEPCSAKRCLKRSG